MFAIYIIREIYRKLYRESPFSVKIYWAMVRVRVRLFTENAETVYFMIFHGR